MLRHVQAQVHTQANTWRNISINVVSKTFFPAFFNACIHMCKHKFIRKQTRDEIFQLMSLAKRFSQLFLTHAYICANTSSYATNTWGNISINVVSKTFFPDFFNACIHMSKHKFIRKQTHDEIFQLMSLAKRFSQLFLTHAYTCANTSSYASKHVTKYFN